MAPECVYFKVLFQQAGAAWAKLEKYWNLCDQAPAYHASLIPDPRQKKSYEYWTEDKHAGSETWPDCREEGYKGCIPIPVAPVRSYTAIDSDDEFGGL